MQAPVPPKKYLKAHSAGAELTPLTRLARFKEIRDRNLARASSLKTLKRSNLVLGSSADTMLNGNGDPSSTNGVAHSANGSDEHRETLCSTVKPKSPIKGPKELNGVEFSAQNGSEQPLKEPAHSPKKNTSTHQAALASAQNGVTPDEHSVANSPPQDAVAPQLVEDVVADGEEAETEGGSGSEAEENGHESSGSSLEVVVDESTTESLDLQISLAEEFHSPQDSSQDVPGPSGSRQDPAPLNPDEPYIPDVIKRLNSGGQISSRPTLTERRKRRPQDDPYSESGRKRHCDDQNSPAALSTSWQFFSPSSALKKIWTRQGDPPADHKPVDDSMIVNFSTSEPPKAQRWCSIM